MHPKGLRSRCTWLLCDQATWRQVVGRDLDRRCAVVFTVLSETAVGFSAMYCSINRQHTALGSETEENAE